MEHDHRRFDLELLDLRERIGQMGDLVVEQIDSAIRCLTEHDISSARIIIDRDNIVNRMDIELETMCLQLLALHQPVASDLRLITAAMKITTELERIGDRVVNICEVVHDGDERDPVTSHDKISQMGALATAMVRDSVTAFSRQNSAIARQVISRTRNLTRSMVR